MVVTTTTMFNTTKGYIMTKQDKLLALLRTGKEFTAAEISKKTGLVNPTAAICQLRDRQLVAIYGNKRQTRNGEVTKYRIGTPTRSMMAQGYTA